MKISNIGWKYLRKLSNFKEWINKQPTFHNPLNFGDINLFIGENGSGKSTIIDAIHAMTNAEKLKSLPRENIVNSVQPEFSILFEDKSSVMYEYTSISCIQTRLPINASFKVDQTLKSNKGVTTTEHTVFKKINDTSNINKLNLNNVDIFYTECNHPQNIQFTQVHVDELNKLVGKVSGLSHKIDVTNGTKIQNCFYLNSNGALSLVLDDDDVMHNHINGDFLPSGWKSYVALIWELLALEDKTICLIEEPERNLHPALQRTLIKRIIEISETKKLQLFVTSHSATIINSLHNKSKLFLCTSNHIKESKMSKYILELLGYKASDLLQHNGLIWIEGPSDRIYIKAWLNAYSTIMGLPKLTENEDYQFSLYGGSTLSHFGSTNDLINIFKSNPNSIMVMDNDNHYVEGQITSKTKKRIHTSYHGHKSGFCWITNDYTIESYLPKKFKDQYFKFENSILKLDSGYSKVFIAERFSSNPVNSKNLLNSNYKLKRWVKRMYLHIEKWNAD